MLVHIYNFLLQILLKLMHTYHDFVATKTCPSCEFLVLSDSCGCGLRWSAGRVDAVWKCAGKISQTPAGAGWGGFKFCGCGAGAEKKLTRAGLYYLADTFCHMNEVSLYIA